MSETRPAATVGPALVTQRAATSPGHASLQTPRLPCEGAAWMTLACSHLLCLFLAVHP